MSNSFNEAVSHFARGDLIKAQERLSAALAQDPAHGEAWHLQGVLALNANKMPEAVEHLTRAAKLRPQDVAIHTNLAAALNGVARFQEAEHILKQVVGAQPMFAEAHYQIGVGLMARERTADAAEAFSEAVRLKPEWVPALEMAAHTLFHAGKHERAAEYAQRALVLEPHRPVSHRVLADAYLRWLRYDEAEKHYLAALKLAPTDGAIRGNYALLLTRLGRTTEAVMEYKQAVIQDPKSVQTREGLSFALLTSGQFEEAWPGYAARTKAPGEIFTTRKGAPIVTDPAQIAGQSVLAWLDQGIGDQIMFASLIPDLIATGAKLTVECDPRLIPILQRSFPQIKTRQIAPPCESDGFAYQTYIPDTARWFRNSFSAFPRHAGYLMADKDLTQKLRRSYIGENHDRPLIGISWRTAVNAKVSIQKTLALAEWRPLLVGHKATFVNLQYGDTREEIADAHEKLGTSIICDAIVDPMQDMDTFAAQVAAMDLVITTSNATAHMAGSLNVPVWTFVPQGYGAMWHWFRDRSDSPWYPSMRLFRQPVRGDWQSVLEQTAHALTDFLGDFRGDMTGTAWT